MKENNKCIEDDCNSIIGKTFDGVYFENIDKLVAYPNLVEIKLT